MPDDFVPGPPDFQLYEENEQGDMIWKDRTHSGGMWKREKEGKVYWVGKVGGKRRVMYAVEKAEDAKESW